MPVIRHPEWRDEQESTKFPFIDSATLVNEQGDQLTPVTFLDATFHVIGCSDTIYLSKVTVTSEEVTIYIGDSSSNNIASGTYDRSSPPDTLELVDAFERPAGLLISESIRMALFSAWTIGDHEFRPEQTAFVARCCHAIPDIGFRGFALDDGSILSGDIWLVGDDGVVLTCSTEQEPNTCGSYKEVTSIRVDIVGDPLFRRKLCSAPTFFETPKFLQTLTFCSPGLLDSSSHSAFIEESTYDSSLNPFPDKVDVLLLSDTTSSMQPYIDSVKILFSPLAAAVTAELPTIDFNWGAAEYRDNDPTSGPYFSEDDWGYKPNQAFSTSTELTQTAIDNWTAALTELDGGPHNPDIDEEQLLAFINIANNWTDPSRLNGRTDAVKVIVWIGDAPGKYGFTPFPDSVLVAAEALAAKEIKVIACSPFGMYDGIDESGQAGNIALETGGTILYAIFSNTVEQMVQIIRDELVRVSTTKRVTVRHESSLLFSYPSTDTVCAMAGPCDLGDIKITVHSLASPETILRVRPTQQGLKIETVGETLENII